ncbi:LGFP repeat-containing protein [Subtercola sp. YIM 133946]|uniref:LGFP repeat-containing protein n=1 Tax=Subtercola sp. YIM 133946 TaxID=3118909 RepID=UPI002F934F6F
MTTPAVNVLGADAIAAKWQELGGEAGALGAADSPPEDAGFGGVLQRFRGGSIGWQEQFGAHALFGTISARWLERTRFQYTAFPVEDQRSVTDGTGSVALLRALDPTGKPVDELALCATTDGRASEIDGAIWQHWSTSGEESSPVGLPVDTAGTTIDGLGSRQEFQHGWMCSHPAVGAAMLNGQISDRWAELGFDRYG